MDCRGRTTPLGDGRWAGAASSLPSESEALAPPWEYRPAGKVRSAALEPIRPLSRSDSRRSSAFPRHLQSARRVIWRAAARSIPEKGQTDSAGGARRRGVSVLISMVKQLSTTLAGKEVDSPCGYGIGSSTLDLRREVRRQYRIPRRPEIYREPLLRIGRSGIDASATVGASRDRGRLQNTSAVPH